MPAKKASSKKSAAARKPADAITVLKQDHALVKELLGKLEKASGPRREKLYQQIDRELNVHATIEEEIFYPAYRDAVRKKDDKQMYYEAMQEHHVVKLVLPETNDAGSKEEANAKAKVLKELVEHHIEEEEKEMFKKARAAMDRDELRALGERLLERKMELGG